VRLPAAALAAARRGRPSLEHDVSPETRRALLRVRAYASFLARRPQLEAAAAAEPENVIWLADT
jgi:hypothetical protein